MDNYVRFKYIINVNPVTSVKIENIGHQAIFLREVLLYSCILVIFTISNFTVFDILCVITLI